MLFINDSSWKYYRSEILSKNVCIVKYSNSSVFFFWEIQSVVKTLEKNPLSYNEKKKKTIFDGTGYLN